MKRRDLERRLRWLDVSSNGKELHTPSGSTQRLESRKPSPDTTKSKNRWPARFSPASVRVEGSFSDDAPYTRYRYLHHEERGSRVLLFVREENRRGRVTLPFLCLVRRFRGLSIRSWRWRFEGAGGLREKGQPHAA